VLTGVILTVVGMWTKCLINKSFNYVFLG